MCEESKVVDLIVGGKKLALSRIFETSYASTFLVPLRPGVICMSGTQYADDTEEGVITKAGDMLWRTWYSEEPENWYFLFRAGAGYRCFLGWCNHLVEVFNFEVEERDPDLSYLQYRLEESQIYPNFVAMVKTEMSHTHCSSGKLKEVLAKYPKVFGEDGYPLDKTRRSAGVIYTVSAEGDFIKQEKW